MRARVVIGANFGDEGKGLITDYLCSQGAGVVVRFNGGAQAGHTVVAPDGRRHVFKHFGSGTFMDVPTFLSQFFICNPIVFFRELSSLHAFGVQPTVYAHPECLVTTFADMMINQQLEDARGAKRHGSVGFGISETIERSQVPELKITMADVWNGAGGLRSRLQQICGKYAEFRIGKRIAEPEMIDKFIEGCGLFAESVHPAGIGQCKDPVFEGAQGLLLDQNNTEYFPHLTRSNTGMRNVRELCDQGGFGHIEAYYVSRTYLTRHGAGPLPGEDDRLSYEDSTNAENAYQGRMRFAPLDTDRLLARCRQDFGGDGFRVVLTHCDQHPARMRADLTSDGPTRENVSAAASA